MPIYRVIEHRRMKAIILPSTSHEHLNCIPKVEGVPMLGDEKRKWEDDGRMTTRILPRFPPFVHRGFSLLWYDGRMIYMKE